MRLFPFLRHDSAQETRPDRLVPEEGGLGGGWRGRRKTEVRAGRVSQLLGCRGRGHERADGARLLEELHKTGPPTDQCIFLAVKFIDFNMNPTMLLKPQKKH